MRQNSKDLPIRIACNKIHRAGTSYNCEVDKSKPSTKSMGLNLTQHKEVSRERGPWKVGFKTKSFTETRAKLRALSVASAGFLSWTKLSTGVGIFPENTEHPAGYHTNPGFRIPRVVMH